MAKAGIAVPVAWVVAGGIAVAIADSVLPGQKYEDNPPAFTVVLAATLVVQELILLAAAAWFTARKYGLSWAMLGLREPDGASRWFAPVLGLTGLIPFTATSERYP
jgi:hypothetical protein